MKAPRYYRSEGDPNHIFLALPGKRAIYLRTSPHILLCRCSWCGAEKGFPCLDRKGNPSASVHGPRLYPTLTCAKCGEEYRGRRGSELCFPCRLESNKRTSKRCSRLYAARHPERLAAGQAVRRALRNGTLKRPTACESCGQPDQPRRRLHAHHASYAPEHHLEVEWLCTACHAKERVTERKAS